MSENTDELLKGFASNNATSDAVIKEIETTLDCSLPEGYRIFLKTQNGGEGFIRHHYLILWRAEEIVEFNRGYEVEKYAPGLLLFGSNGGGEAFAFNCGDASMAIVMVPFIGMRLKDAQVIASTFSGFLKRLHTDEDLI